MMVQVMHECGVMHEYIVVHGRCTSTSGALKVHECKWCTIGARVWNGAQEVHEYGVMHKRYTSTSGTREVHEYGVVRES